MSKEDRIRITNKEDRTDLWLNIKECLDRGDILNTFLFGVILLINVESFIQSAALLAIFLMFGFEKYAKGRMDEMDEQEEIRMKYLRNNLGFDHNDPK